MSTVSSDEITSQVSDSNYTDTTAVVEQHKGSWDASSVPVTPNLVRPLDDDELVTISECKSVETAFCADLKLKRGTLRRTRLHRREHGPKPGWAFRYGGTNLPGVPYEKRLTKRLDGLEYVHGFYADWDAEWVSEAYAAIVRANGLGTATDVYFTGSLDKTQSEIADSVVHKHAGLLNEKGRPLRYPIARASVEQIVAAFRSGKPWHPEFAASVVCAVNENGAPKVKGIRDHRKDKDGVDMEVTRYEYVVNHKPRCPLRAYFHSAAPVQVKTPEQQAAFAKAVAKFFQLIGAPPYDKCVFNVGQPIYPNRGLVRPTQTHVAGLPDGLTFVDDGDLSYIVGKGAGAINFDALSVLPEPDTAVWLGSKHSQAKKVGKGKGPVSNFIPNGDEEELGAKFMNAPGIRRGFQAGDLFGVLSDMSEETAKGLVVGDCFTDEHNASGRKQMFARNGDPASGKWPSFGCRDDNCSVCDNGALDGEGRLAWLIGFALKHGYLTADELLEEYFADEMSRLAARRIIRANEDDAPDWEDDGPSVARRARKFMRRNRRINGGA